MGALAVLGIVAVLTGFTAMALAEDSSAFTGFCICVGGLALLLLAFTLRLVGLL